MPKNGYNLSQRTAMLALMVAARDLNNNELKEMTGSSLTGQPSKELNDAKLITSDTKARPQVHSLTDDGWAWCAKELEAGAPPTSRSGAEKTLYTVLAGLHGYLSRTGLKLADVFTPQAPRQAVVHADAESQIREAYRKLRTEPRGWVSLTELRPLITGHSKAKVDAALTKMNRTKGVNLIPQSNQKILTADDRAAMVRIGNEDKLLLSIDEP
ncbi:hypothetical protein [Allorhizocola rhizosphaerae]|uniref:hypothetical protein n=1 Tax=Allorhizocola rhizosphaerae TaxID=1872709 RepID=UPI000E3E6016|nr:hypothetical protein [Allorhizocola rhizosphaerae]